MADIIDVKTLCIFLIFVIFNVSNVLKVYFLIIYNKNAETLRLRAQRT